MPDEPPDVVICPISQDVLAEPILAADGQVYERSMLDAWFAAGKRTSPLTNKEMSTATRLDRTTLAEAKAW